MPAVALSAATTESVGGAAERSVPQLLRAGRAASLTLSFASTVGTSMVGLYRSSYNTLASGAGDAAKKAGVLRFNQYDLYTKADVVPVLRILLPVVPLADAVHEDHSDHRPGCCESQAALAFVPLLLVDVHLPREGRGSVVLNRHKACLVKVDRH